MFDGLFPAGVGRSRLPDVLRYSPHPACWAFCMDATGCAKSLWANQMVKWLGVGPRLDGHLRSPPSSCCWPASAPSSAGGRGRRRSPLMKAANLPRKVGMIAAQGIAPAITFCMPVPNVPGSLPNHVPGHQPSMTPPCCPSCHRRGWASCCSLSGSAASGAARPAPTAMGYDGPGVAPAQWILDNAGSAHLRHLSDPSAGRRWWPPLSSWPHST